MTGASRASVGLTRRGVALTILAALVIVAWFAAGLRDLLAVAALAIAAIVVSAAVAVATWGFARPTARVTAAVHAPTVNDAVGLTAVISHRLPLPLSGTLVWHGPGGLGALHGLGSGIWDTPVTLAPGAATACPTQWSAERRGPVELTAAYLSVVDPLGLCRFRMPLGAATTLLVLPRPLPLSQVPEAVAGTTPARISRGAPAAWTESGSRGAGSSQEQPSGMLRGYQVGDPLKRIHWKQSAKLDQLLVNIPETSVGERFVVALVTDLEAYPGLSGTFDRGTFERAVSLAATLVTRGRGGSGAGTTRAPSLQLQTVAHRAGSGADVQVANTRAGALEMLARAEPAELPADTDEAAARVRQATPTVVVTGVASASAAALTAATPGTILVTVSPRETRGDGGSPRAGGAGLAVFDASEGVSRGAA